MYTKYFYHPHNSLPLALSRHPNICPSQLCVHFLKNLSPTECNQCCPYAQRCGAIYRSMCSLPKKNNSSFFGSHYPLIAPRLAGSLRSGIVFLFIFCFCSCLVVWLACSVFHSKHHFSSDFLRQFYLFIEFYFHVIGWLAYFIQLLLVVAFLECSHRVFTLLEHSYKHFELFVWEFLQVVPIGAITVSLVIWGKALPWFFLLLLVLLEYMHSSS